MPALIFIALAAFVVIDLYIVYRVFKKRRSADDLATIVVPGQADVQLNPGKVKLSYQESYTAGSTTGDDIDFDVPAALNVTVTAPSGEEVEVKGPGFGGYGSSKDTGRGWSRSVIGSFHVTHAGVYDISALGELPDAVEPKVLVGR